MGACIQYNLLLNLLNFAKLIINSYCLLCSCGNPDTCHWIMLKKPVKRQLTQASRISLWAQRTTCRSDTVAACAMQTLSVCDGFFLC